MIRSPLIDNDGSGALICGFVLRRGQKPVRVEKPRDVLSIVDSAQRRPDEAAWLHFNLSDLRSRHWLEQCDVLPPEGRALLLDDEDHVRIAPVAGGLGGVLRDLSYGIEVEPDRVDALWIYVNEGVLITARRHPLKTTDALRQELESAAEAEGRAFPLLLRLLNDLADTYDGLGVEFSKKVDAAEDRILDERHLDVSESLGRIHRVLTRLRRHVAADRQALSRVIPQLPAWCTPEERQAFVETVDRIDGIASDLSNEQDRARLLQEDIARRVNESTSRNLYFLSIVTAIFLPITLISGIFGMNVPDLPWDHQAGGFWIVIFVMLCTVGLTLLVLRWRRII